MNTLDQFLEYMLQDLQLRGMSTPTQDNYTHAVRKVSEYYQKLPDCISEKVIRDYFLYFKNVKKYDRAASNLAICGLKFFYAYTLKCDWPTRILPITVPFKPIWRPVSPACSHEMRLVARFAPDPIQASPYEVEGYPSRLIGELRR
ncbi:phage integrase N-terminal SAM-like domain-containing protein [candidate division KSB1 bacterium]|nr:phage integrase N-terminal SAM-like domain-containing protein [candidate division KSB1 bacterium]